MGQSGQNRFFELTIKLARISCDITQQPNHPQSLAQVEIPLTPQVWKIWPPCFLFFFFSFFFPSALKIWKLKGKPHIRRLWRSWPLARTILGLGDPCWGSIIHLILKISGWIRRESNVGSYWHPPFYSTHNLSVITLQLTNATHGLTSVLSYLLHNYP